MNILVCTKIREGKYVGKVHSFEDESSLNYLESILLSAESISQDNLTSGRGAMSFNMYYDPHDCVTHLEPSGRNNGDLDTLTKKVAWILDELDPELASIMTSNYADQLALGDEQGQDFLDSLPWQHRTNDFRFSMHQVQLLTD